ncbi:Alanine--tRNA ligase [Pseudovibrio sp. W64]|uniref:alanyl-tRNA editing protein n=1 Tax=unclassified Pseudovibrio TaxID=2627060 RepID=UPI0007AE4BBF|nr:MULTISPECIES: alanyl-tRNA editing protein [unclassified Pseudovibrio]KZK76353.1 Alanine--tRNA ligase [Pseudovibrio sp. W64]KZK82197.1 Alanine--tRNA ligase [Pseudovibrio sp. Ad13]
MTEHLYREDAYLRSSEAAVNEITPEGGIILDRTCFYPNGGGQPGDCGSLELEDDTRIPIATAVYSKDRSQIVHVPADGTELPAGLTSGAKITAHIDWETRYKRMRVHTALHLLSVVLPFPVTGGQISDGTGRLDFDIPEAALDKEELTGKLQDLIANDDAITQEWITDEELEANPGLVKTMSVKPPMGSGRLRLIRIGEDVDLQPCGGTHVSQTAQIGKAVITKIEKKGRQNRRVRIQLED